MRIGHTFIGILACSFLASCTQPLGHGEIDWDHGARRARVLEVLSPQAAEAEARDCAPAGWNWQAGHAYARVRYRVVRLHRNTVATLPEGLALQPGDEVELWPENCGEHRLARVERRLSAPAQDR
ncbi:hypothetical protein ACI48D_00110 [Massilia sp. LXY-6]|uniref:hypothetical protein n=1 Tax=Massilia sp. LXY-6 TaxID=3379823 RepID=UPI003EE2334E